MIESTLTPLIHALALQAAIPDPGFAFALLQGKYGFWTSIINLLQGLVLAAGGLGFTVGLAMKASAGHNQDRHALANKLMEGSVVGLFVGLLAVAGYNLLNSWM